ncbi:LPS-assembly lipoprotein [Cribrihabitans marinus]|uniref:LPS-assembly lipoprotein n=2 Tax=Cribrihabitans marinus TaxID=1227549 RepID=A0A1H6XS37_9RHOB|nr:hypothetical protein GCM10010973_15980 [Cribrihabitans marinus]SEJ29577.1 LPS-assembly lipoprotein [Cribrihabitans marinus]
MLPLALAACGFQPVYGPGGTGAALYGRVRVSEPNGVDSYVLVQTLEERLGRSADPAYDLGVALSLTQQGQVITEDNATTRYSIVGTVDYVLTEIASGRVAASGRVNEFTSYSATGSSVETVASERDARRRLMTILADQVTAQLNATADVPA